MAGGKSTPKKDKMMKVSGGMLVKTGKILSRGALTFKPGANVGGMSTLYALKPGKIYFTKKKTSHGRVRTFINIAPIQEKSPK